MKKNERLENVDTVERYSLLNIKFIYSVMSDFNKRIALLNMQKFLEDSNYSSVITTE